MTTHQTIDLMLAAARERIRRYAPHDAQAAAMRGAAIVDTRSGEDVRREGWIAGSIYHHRNVLEWRCDPTSGYADRRIARYDRRIIVVCNDGYSSSLAAASLVALGFRNAGDLIGGFRAWKAAGLPVEFDASLAMTFPLPQADGSYPRQPVRRT